VVGGEVTTTAWADIPRIVRERVLAIGYDSSAKGFDGASCGVQISIGSQSPDIAQGVDHAYEDRAEGSHDPLDTQGAGDQGLMFGYACDDTPELMPLPITMAHQLAAGLATVRKDGAMPYLRPDGKTQVTMRYDGDRPQCIDTVVVSTQHARDVDLDVVLTPEVRSHVVDPVLAELELACAGYRLMVNPTGRFEIGGPMGDSGVTGRKIILDTYGGMARHGGGAFSGKDPSKVDRSGAYAMRWVAKNVVAAGLARRCECQVAYAIGSSHPVSFFLDCFGTEAVPAERISAAVLGRLRSATGRDHRRPRPAAPHLRRYRDLRPLRPGPTRLHLGAHRPGGSVAARYPRLSGPVGARRDRSVVVPPGRSSRSRRLLGAPGPAVRLRCARRLVRQRGSRGPRQGALRGPQHQRIRP
jgi:S-adenosylmethionine synthetase